MNWFFCGSLANIESGPSNAGSVYNPSNAASQVADGKETKLDGGAHLSTIPGTKSNVEEPKPSAKVKTSLTDPSSVEKNVSNAISNYDKSIGLECIFGQRKVYVDPASPLSQVVGAKNQPTSPHQEFHPLGSKQQFSQDNQGSLGQQSNGINFCDSKEQPGNFNEPTKQYKN